MRAPSLLIQGAGGQELAMTAGVLADIIYLQDLLQKAILLAAESLTLL
jgi:hypothetical protein